MAHSDHFRETVQKAVDDLGAEEVGRQIGVSGEQVRQYVANPQRTLRVKEAAKYAAWARGASPTLAKGWEPAVFLAGYAEAILGIMEDAATRQRVLVERLRALSPEAMATAQSGSKKEIPAHLLPAPEIVETVRAKNRAGAEAAKARRDQANREGSKKSAGSSR